MFCEEIKKNAKTPFHICRIWIIIEELTVLGFAVEQRRHIK